MAEERRFTFRPDISLGHVISFGTVMFCAAVAWGVQTSRVDALVERITKSENKAAAHDTLINEMNMKLTRIDEKQDVLKDALKEIKDSLKK